MTPSPQLKKALDLVKADGCNIYMLLNKLKNQINTNRIKKGYPKADIEFPEQALFNVCASYWKYKPYDPWPWLNKVIKIESDKYLQDQEVIKHEKQKKMKPAKSMEDAVLDWADKIREKRKLSG